MLAVRSEYHLVPGINHGGRYGVYIEVAHVAQSSNDIVACHERNALYISLLGGVNRCDSSH